MLSYLNNTIYKVFELQFYKSEQVIGICDIGEGGGVDE